MLKYCKRGGDKKYILCFQLEKCYVGQPDCWVENIEINFNTYKNLTIRFENHTNISLFIQADSPQQAGVDLLKVQ